LIVGALSYANIDKVDKHLAEANVDVSASPIALIVVGSIVFVVAFYGCCGAIRESHCMVVTVRDTVLHSEWMSEYNVFRKKKNFFYREAGSDHRSQELREKNIPSNCQLFTLGKNNSVTSVIYTEVWN
jgi:hypothetical protein